MELKAIITESLKGKGQHVQHQLQSADREAAVVERAKEMTRFMGMESFPYVEKELDKLPRCSLFDMPQLSQKTPVRPTMQPHYTAPGPATDGPAKPGISGNGVPINTGLTAKPPTAQPSGGDKGHAPAATPPGGAGQDKDGDGHNTAPSTEILSALANA
eukprot:9354391-Pyramimonas_sp.AAC.1